MCLLGHFCRGVASWRGGRTGSAFRRGDSAHQDALQVSRAVQFRNMGYFLTVDESELPGLHEEWFRTERHTFPSGAARNLAAAWSNQRLELCSSIQPLISRSTSIRSNCSRLPRHRKRRVMATAGVECGTKPRVADKLSLSGRKDKPLRALDIIGCTALVNDTSSLSLGWLSVYE